VLGLTPGCTQEEAAAKYRQLASSYHPDRVNNLAPEFKALAHQKMTEINNAFADLKRLRGW
jgi:DnaJ-class molecular chaperone